MCYFLTKIFILYLFTVSPSTGPLTSRWEDKSEVLGMNQ